MLLITSTLGLLISGCATPEDEVKIFPAIETSLLMEGCTIGGSSSHLPTVSSSKISGWEDQVFDSPIIEFGLCGSITTPNSTQTEVSYAIIKSEPQASPDACKIHPDNNMKILQWGIFNNQAVVDYFQSKGAPIMLGSLEIDLDAGSMPSARVSWNSAGGNGVLENTIREVQFIDYSKGRNLAWQNEEHLMVWDQNLKTQLSAEIQNSMSGTLDETITAAPINGNWLGTTEFYLEASYSGQIHQFSDFTCSSTANTGANL
jgi:hypothetical protein